MSLIFLIISLNKNLFLFFSPTGEILGNIMVLLLKNKDFERACVIMDKLDQDQQSVLGVPDFEALSLFVDNCIDLKLPSRAIVSFKMQDIQELFIPIYDFFHF